MDRSFLTATAAASLATVCLAIWVYKWKKRWEWLPDVAVVRSLYVYPIKSVPGISVSGLHVSPDGVSCNGIDDR